MFQTKTLFGISQPLTLWSFVATYRQVQFISKLCTCVPTTRIHYFPLNNLHSSEFLIDAHRVICEVPTDTLHTMWINFCITHGTGFDHRPFHVRLTVDKWHWARSPPPAYFSLSVSTASYQKAEPAKYCSPGQSNFSDFFFSLSLFKTSTLRGSLQDIRHTVMHYMERHSHANVTFATELAGAATHKLMVSRPSRVSKTKNTGT